MLRSRGSFKASTMKVDLVSAQRSRRSRQRHCRRAARSAEGRNSHVSPAHGGNRLLAALPPADLALLSPHLQKVSLEQDAVVVRSGDRREHVYFPHSGAISFMLDMPNGATIATAVIGREGALGALSVLGPSRSSVTAVVRVGGTASHISVSRFHAAYMGSSAIRDVVQAHTGAIYAAPVRRSL